MKRNPRFIGLLLLCALGVRAQEGRRTDLAQNLPVSPQTLLNRVKSPDSKGVIKSIPIFQCPKDNIKGTGFAVDKGKMVVTNSHVVGRCSAAELVGTSPVAEAPVRFSRLEADANRSLAVLCPSKPLPFGLELGGTGDPQVETEVETWGYLLKYSERAPILSRGYIAGYRTELVARPGQAGFPVKHLIVNGALNPGNSGGPLIDRQTGKVIGVVVEKWTLWSPNIEMATRGFSHSSISTGGTFSRINPQTGQQEGATDQEVLAAVLAEFYNASQVMIGEAISDSEVAAFRREREQSLSCGR